jgi:hypothetical protein
MLRHQLKVLRRGGRRVLFSMADRAFLAAVARVLSRNRWKSFLVGPDTLTRWHRDLLKRRSGRGSRPPGRPPLDPPFKHLILRLGRENPRWGYLRIRGGAPETRDRCLGHEHRHGAARRRTRPGATPDRADVDPVPETAGVWPSLPRCSLRGGQLGGPPVRARGDDRGPGHGRDRRTDPGRSLRTQEHRCAPTATCIPEDGVPT